MKGWGPRAVLPGPRSWVDRRSGGGLRWPWLVVVVLVRLEMSFSSSNPQQSQGPSARARVVPNPALLGMTPYDEVVAMCKLLSPRAGAEVTVTRRGVTPTV